MRKNPETLKARAKYVQDEINNRHKSENCKTCVARIARVLFLSEQIIWKDFAKDLDKM